MTKFLINLFNHNALGQATLYDVAAIVIHQLRALGHQADWKNDVCIADPDVVNVLFEGFTDMTLDSIINCHTQGARFMYIVTEQAGEDGFNHNISPEMVGRWKMFPKAAYYAEALLCLVPGSAKWCSQYANATDVELGYAPTLVRKPKHYGSDLPIQPDHLFGFFGSLTPRREEVLRSLGRRQVGVSNAVLVKRNFAHQVERDQMVARCRLVTLVRAHDKIGLVSSSRCNTALHCGRPVVAEPHELSYPWNQIIHFSKSTDAFYDDCGRMHKDWKAIHKKQFKAFKQLLSPERQIGRALRDVGLVKTPNENPDRRQQLGIQ